MVAAVGKAARVLELFTSERPDWGVTEAAAALDLPRSSAHDLLSTLVDTGLLQRSEQHRYRLGWKVVALGRTVLSTCDVRNSSRPVVHALARKLGATVHLAAFDRAEVIYIDKLVPSGGLPVPLTGVGQRMPPHSSALGKVLLAHQPRAVAVAALERSGMPRFTERTASSIDALMRELDTVRQTGTARDHQETMDGVCCHAAPVFDWGGVVAAISVCVPSSGDEGLGTRFNAVTTAAGSRISRNLRQLGVGANGDSIPRRMAMAPSSS